MKAGQPVAELRSLAAAKPQPQFGSCKGMLTVVAEDDEHLEDAESFAEENLNHRGT
jgi:hypothetical protein